MRTIAEDWLDWEKLGPVVARYRALIEKEVEADTRKLSSLAAFRKAVADDRGRRRGDPLAGRPALSLRAFADAASQVPPGVSGVKGVDAMSPPTRRGGGPA